MYSLSSSQAACWLCRAAEGTPSLFQKTTAGQTSALSSAICDYHKHQILFAHVRLRRMVVGSWGSAGKEQLSAVPIFTFVPECLSRSHPSTSGWTGRCLLCLSFLLNWASFAQAFCDMLMDIVTWLTHSLCSAALLSPAGTADASNFRVGRSTRRNLALKNTLLTTFKI